MIGLEWPGRGTPGDILEHGSFHFKETAVLQEAADLRDHLRALDEERGTLGIAHQVEVALPILDLAVRHAVILIRHRTQRFRKHGELLHLDGRLAGLGQEGLPLDADPVSAIQAFPGGQGGFVERLGVHVALDFPMHVGQLEEAGLAELPEHGDPPRHLHLAAFGKSRMKLGRRGGNLEPRSIWVDAEGAEFREFLAADSDQFGFGVLRRRRGDGFTHVLDGVGGSHAIGKSRNRLAFRIRHSTRKISGLPDAILRSSSLASTR